MDLHFWAMCAFTNVMALMCGIIFMDGQLIILSLVMLGYSLYQFGDKAGLL